MKSFDYNFNKLLQHEVRLGIMSALMVNDWVDYNSLKDILQVTDGNLASNLNRLEKEEYIIIKKEFEDRKPKTSYQASDLGKKEFQNHLIALEKFINSQQ